MTLLIVDLGQYCVCCIRSSVTRCTLLMVFYLGRMCQCWFHAVLRLHISIHKHGLAAEPHSTAGLFFLFQCPSETILLSLYSMVWDRCDSRARPMLFHWPKQLYPYYRLLLFFPFSSFCLSVGIVGLGSSD